MRSYLGDGTPVHYVYRGDEETATSRIRVVPFPGPNAGDVVADARVMAAGPETLAALRAAFEWMKDVTGHEPERFLNVELDAAEKAGFLIEAAIAKAEGRTS